MEIDKEIRLFAKELVKECYEHDDCRDCKYFNFCLVDYIPASWGSNDVEIAVLIIKAWEQRKNEKQIKIKK